MKSIRLFFKKHWPFFAIVALLIGLFFTLTYFIHNIELSYSQGELRPEYHPLHPTKILPLQDHQLQINDIQPWMTFDYVNVVFKLPKNYLKDILGISDQRYPNLRIDTYSKETNFNKPLLLQTIKKYTASYNPS
jgi:hypothetical protein